MCTATLLQGQKEVACKKGLNFNPGLVNIMMKISQEDFNQDDKTRDWKSIWRFRSCVKDLKNDK